MTPPDYSQLSLRIGTHEAARYHSGHHMGAQVAPRPYLEVRTPGGAWLTELEPDDHPHHYGVSAAIVDINGTSYWGGKSYVDGQGYVMLPNQGRQWGGRPRVHEREITELTQELTWSDSSGADQLTEQRTIRFGSSARATANLMTWRSTLRPLQEVKIGSPATRGRTGAGYGGLFWRWGPQAPTTVRTSTGASTESAALGSRSTWLTLTQQRSDGPLTLLLAQPAAELLPWFVRVSGYVGAGPAVAWERPQSWAAQSTHSLHLWAAAVEGTLEDDQATSLHQELELLAT
ncbi:MAG: DUF6807 family protein [Beutenbergiaceae bacterium]